jgi:hypothetical protein
MTEQIRQLIIAKIKGTINEQQKELIQIEEYILELEIDLAAFEEDFEKALELTKQLEQYKLLTSI